MRNSLLILLLTTGWLIAQLSLVQHEYSSNHGTDAQCEWCTQHNNGFDDLIIDTTAGLSSDITFRYLPKSRSTKHNSNERQSSYQSRAPPL